MTDGSARSVDITRLGLGRYEAVNPRGGTLRFGSGAGGGGDEFTPVELLLTAIAGCTAADVDYITVKRAEPTTFEVHATGTKVRDETGNRMEDIVVRLEIGFPDGEEGDAARAVLPSAVQRSHDRLCTVSRTVERETPVAVEVV